MHAERDLAYIAGMLDGEGSVTFSKVKDNHSRFGHAFRLAVRIVNTEKSVMEYFYDLFGGYIYSVKTI